MKDNSTWDTDPSPDSGRVHTDRQDYKYKKLTEKIIDIFKRIKTYLVAVFWERFRIVQ